jgi:alkaline phosphatase D
MTSVGQAWQLAAILAIAASATSTALASPPYQANGVKVGEATPTSVIVWTRLTENPQRLNDGLSWATAEKDTAPDQMEGAVPGAPGEVRVLYCLANSGTETATDWVAVDPKRDYTHHLLLSGLKPGSRYAYRVECRGADGAAGPTIEGIFQTVPAADDPARATFIVVTGQMYKDRDCPEGYKSYASMLKLDPSFFVHTGDIVYYDGEPPIAQNVAQARHHWHRMYSLPSLIDFHRQVSSYFIKDDHDTWLNDCWPTMKTKKMGDFTFIEGKAVFLDEVPMGQSTYRTIRWGKDLQVWLPEGRDFRSPNNMPDGPDKTIWGQQQKDWFKRTVEASDAAFRVVISPTPLVGPDRTNKADNHANKAFTHEGDELRALIASQKNTVTCCGDRHWQYVSVHPESGVREYSCGPISTEHAGGWSQDEYVKEYHKYLNVTGGFLAGTVERQDGRPTLTFRHYSPDGRLLHEDRLTAE